MSPARWTEADLLLLPPSLREQVRGELSKNAPRGTPPVKETVRKYHNTPTMRDGIRFPSKLEARCYDWHVDRQAAGEIAWFIRQVPFLLEGGIVYRADFLAVRSVAHAITEAKLEGREEGGPPEIVEVTDAKGRLTSECRNKLKQVYARYGVKVKLWPPR